MQGHMRQCELCPEAGIERETRHSGHLRSVRRIDRGPDIQVIS
jgi:hypothetical protein